MSLIQHETLFCVSYCFHSHSQLQLTHASIVETIYIVICSKYGDVSHGVNVTALISF